MLLSTFDQFISGYYSLMVVYLSLILQATTIGQDITQLLTIPFEVFFWKYIDFNEWPKVVIK